MTAILKAADIQNHPGPLYSMLKGLAIGVSRAALIIGISAVPVAADVTDSSTGTSDGTVRAMTLPVAFTTAGTDCAPKAGFDTAVGKFADAFEALAEKINLARAKLGLTAIVYSGSPAVSGTVPALDKTLTAVTGTTVCVDFTTGLAECVKIRNSLATLAAALGEVQRRVGTAPIVDASGGTASTTYTLVAQASTAAGNDGTADATIADTVMDAFLTAAAHSVAGLAAQFNAIGVTGVLVRAALTDSSGATAGASLGALTVPSAFTHVTSTDCAQKASFDTAIAAIWAGHKAIAEHLNLARRVLGLDLIVYTGDPTTFGTIPSQSLSVTGTQTAAAAVERVTAATRLNAIKDNLATLARAAYETMSAIGAATVLDSSGGNFLTAYTLTTIAATGTGVDGTAADTMSKAAVDTFLAAHGVNLATLAANINSGMGRSILSEGFAQAAYVG